jgi:hypothetical protein
MKSKQRGFGAVGVLVLLLVAAFVAGTGWYLLAHKDSATQDKTKAANATQSHTGKVITPSQKPATVADFYDCADVVGSFTPGTPPTCVYQGQTYTRPADFTPADVRNLDKLSAGAQQHLLAIAKTNFDKCKTVPQETSVTRVLRYVDDSFVSIATGCDSGYGQVLVNQAGTWVETSPSQGWVSCEEVDKYHIPRALLYSSDSPSSGQCSAADGKLKDISY